MAFDRLDEGYDFCSGHFFDPKPRLGPGVNVPPCFWPFSPGSAPFFAFLAFFFRMFVGMPDPALPRPSRSDCGKGFIFSMGNESVSE